MKTLVLSNWTYFFGCGIACLGWCKLWEYVPTINELLLSIFVVLIGFAVAVFFGKKSDEFAGVKYFLGLITPILFGAVLLIFLT